MQERRPKRGKVGLFLRNRRQPERENPCSGPESGLKQVILVRILQCLRECPTSPDSGENWCSGSAPRLPIPLTLGRTCGAFRFGIRTSAETTI